MTLLDRIQSRLVELEDEDRTRRASVPPPAIDAPAAEHFQAARQSSRRAKQLLVELGTETRRLQAETRGAFQRREESREQVLGAIYKLLDTQRTRDLTEAEEVELARLTQRYETDR